MIRKKRLLVLLAAVVFAGLLFCGGEAKAAEVSFELKHEQTPTGYDSDDQSLEMKESVLEKP